MCDRACLDGGGDACLLADAGCAAFYLQRFRGYAENRRAGTENHFPVLSSGCLGIVGSTFFQAVGKGVNSLLVSLLRQLIVLLPAAFLLAKLGVVEWVWYAFPIAETFSLLATIVLYLRVYKRQIQNLEQEPSRISGPEIV